MVDAFAPQASFLTIGCGIHMNEVRDSVTGLLIPLIVSVPSIDETLSSLKLILFDINVIVGYFAVSKKSSP